MFMINFVTYNIIKIINKFISHKKIKTNLLILNNYFKYIFKIYIIKFEYIKIINII